MPGSSIISLSRTERGASSRVSELRLSMNCWTKTTSSTRTGARMAATMASILLAGSCLSRTLGRPNMGVVLREAARRRNAAVEHIQFGGAVLCLPERGRVLLFRLDGAVRLVGVGFLHFSCRVRGATLRGRQASCRIRHAIQSSPRLRLLDPGRRLVQRRVGGALRLVRRARCALDARATVRTRRG